MTRPWHHRRLRVRPGGRRTSAAVRLRAHDLALGVWLAAVGAGVRLRSVALLSPLGAARLRTRLWRREGMSATCPVCGRRFRTPGDAPWCSVGCMGEAYREPEPAPVPDVGRGRAVRTHRSAAESGKET